MSATFESQFSGSTSGNKVAHVRKADGTPCYSFETTLIGGEVLQYVWKDPSGQVVATGSFVPTQVVCESGGQMSTCNDAAGNPSTGCCPLDDLGTTASCPGLSCSAGSCP